MHRPGPAVREGSLGASTAGAALEVHAAAFDAPRTMRTMRTMRTALTIRTAQTSSDQRFLA